MLLLMKLRNKINYETKTDEYKNLKNDLKVRWVPAVKRISKPELKSVWIDGTFEMNTMKRRYFLQT